MMLETTTVHRSAATWPMKSSSPRQSTKRRRRNSKVVYRSDNTRCSPPRSTRPGSPSAAYHLSMRASDHPHLDYTDIPKVESGNGFGYDLIVHQARGNQAGPESSWQQAAHLISYEYTLSSSNGANSPQFFDGINTSAPMGGFCLQVSNSDQGSSWTGATHSSNANSELGEMPVPSLDIPYGSFDNSMGVNSPLSAGTSNSEGYVFPVIDSALGSPPDANPLSDLDLSDEYFQIGQSFDASLGVPASASQLYDNNLVLDTDGLQAPLAIGNVYASNEPQWSATTANQLELSNESLIEPSVFSKTPWNAQQLQMDGFQSHVNAVHTIEPLQAAQHNAYKISEGYLNIASSSQSCADPVSPHGDSDTESWVITRSNYTPSHSSPRSQGSPKSHVSSPQHQSPPRHHSHVFSSIPGMAKSKISKGRTRNLTQLEKKQARDVREAKACWACHISKTKCSPCSPGSPCEQCTRLVGKRRFCKFSCFNDPLESLHVFLASEYLNGHLNRNDVEAFVARNTESWGTKNMLIRMSWGHRRLLEARVVDLKLRKNAPDAGFHDTSVPAMANDGTEVFVRRRSPPLGIPLAAMDGLQDAYSDYVQDIVQSELRHYIPVAYFPEDSTLMTRLLAVICEFYFISWETDEESELLRRALEMHVTTSIMERTLNLEPESIMNVQNQLQQQFPKETTAKCVQKQMKLAFFMGQQRRINQVLKEWGNLMWTIHNTTNNDKRWAISFCVFLTLTLTMDKICGQTYYFCENNIQHFGAEAKLERTKCAHLLDTAERELFDRCKEIFHWKFKTRKGGKEACNPIRDGLGAFRSDPVDGAIRGLTQGLQRVVREFEPTIRAHCSVRPEYYTGMGKSPYMDLGRLSCIFLDDFLDH